MTGLWKNQRGSTLELLDNGAEGVKGFFTTAVVSTKECVGYAAPLTGAVNDNAISISLTMTGCGSPVVIAMAGAVNKGHKGDELAIQALVQYKGENFWSSRVLSTDTYTRIEDAD